MRVKVVLEYDDGDGNVYFPDNGNLVGFHGMNMTEDFQLLEDAKPDIAALAGVGYSADDLIKLRSVGLL